ncbi:hypothetical protein RvY_09879-2 [Ramazzottius varieornatus]|uniref:Uncharacterized protein n=1 Tax=Ramazzottius varieornatus TaxID=947166 RepID=A0A1D1VD06_RAMVA|nr:hypothetical protein RvY_09879-2 [Ramazzottius varieornatus]
MARCRLYHGLLCPYQGVRALQEYQPTVRHLSRLNRRYDFCLHWCVVVPDRFDLRVLGHEGNCYRWTKISRVGGVQVDEWNVKVHNGLTSWSILKHRTNPVMSLLNLF